MPKQPKTFKVAMLGAAGVGKTSLLTAMYDRFETTMKTTNLQVIADLETSSLLNERLGELTSLLDEFNTQPGKFTKTVKPRKFKFDLGEKGKEPFLRLEFTDFPGEYLDNSSTQQEKEFYKNLVQESHAVIIAIDTPALMEKNGKLHEMINRPSQIKDLFAMVYKNMKSPKLVIFSPVRCESYLSEGKEDAGNELLKEIKLGYDKLLSLFNSPELLPWVVNVVVPVKTLGNVVFSHIEFEEGEPIFHFHKTRHEAKYNPQDSDQVLRYLLRFMLRLEMEDRNFNWGPL